MLAGIAVAQQPPPPPKAREGKAEFALVTTSGNASTQSIGAAGQVIFRPPQWDIDGQTAFVRNEAEDVVSAKSFAARGRAGARPDARGCRRSVSIRTCAISSPVSCIAISPRRAVATSSSRPDRNTLYGDAGLGYLKERRTVGVSLSTPTAGTGTRYKLKLSETSDITDDLLMSFDLSDEGTWRLQHAIALTAKVAAPLSLKVSNLLRYVDEPVAGFEQTDTITSAALVLSF